MEIAYVFLAAWLLDLAIGDPQGWPHPIRGVGLWIDFCQERLYKPSVAAGTVFWLAVVGGVLAVALAITGLARALPFPWGEIILAIGMFFFIATRSLHAESRIVEKALLDGNLPEARSKLSWIVSRETDQLGPPEIRRAAIETVAENLADGVVAPIFFILILGFPGLLFYKAINTLDSMVGYKNEKYLKFGRFSARADDVANFLPARLSALLLVVAARGLRLDAAGAWRILKRDRQNASSPNAGWPEAALAGALGIRLGGPSTYFGKIVNKPTMGDPTHELGPEDFRGAIRLLYASSGLAAVLTFVGLSLGQAGVFGLAGLFF